MYKVYSMFPGGDYSEPNYYNTLAEAKEGLIDSREESLEQVALDENNPMYWQVTTPLRQINRTMLLLGSIEYGSMIDPDNIGTPCHSERENLMIDMVSEDELALLAE